MLIGRAVIALDACADGGGVEMGQRGGGSY